MKLKTLDRKPIAYEIVPEIRTEAPIAVNARGTISMPAFTRLDAAEAKEVAMSVLFAAALAELEGELSKKR